MPLEADSGDAQQADDGGSWVGSGCLPRRLVPTPGGVTRRETHGLDEHLPAGWTRCQEHHSRAPHAVALVRPTAGAHHERMVAIGQLLDLQIWAGRMTAQDHVYVGQLGPSGRAKPHVVGYVGVVNGPPRPARV